MQLSELDRRQYRDLRTEDVLEDIESHRLNHRHGVILITCADGDQLPDIFAHHSLLIQSQHERVRIHQFSLNGGSLLLHPESPLVQEFEEWKILHHHIRGAKSMKGIPSLALYAHAPCGAAGAAGLSLIQCVTLLMAGKEHLRRTLQWEGEIYPFFHVDTGNSKRTYFVSKRKWDLARRQLAGNP